MPEFLKSTSARVLTLVLLLQAGVFYGFSRTERVPNHHELGQFALPPGNWNMIQDVALDKETLDTLKADDILSRIYRNKATGQAANLFVAYFGTQRTGKTPHSPKNCLPGTGWAASEAGVIGIPVQGRREIEVNRYIVSRGQNESVVLYWYQARDRVIASEYSAKIFTVTDAIRYNRTDTALVRVVVTVEGGDTRRASDTAVDFVRSFFLPLREYLPG